ncbi:MAG: hypothetical protein IH849_12690 [Acidobacteria bacterium]|nr:hypothetical protein [Acidobacteriota bacterium]
MSVFLVVAAVVLATAPGGYAAVSFSPPPVAGAQPLPQARAGVRSPLPDLRIVEMKLIPAPVQDGATITLALKLHNDSMSVAAGNIVIEAVHDRGFPQPLPFHLEEVYMGPDALVEVSFEIPWVSMASSPYTFYVMIDVFDAIEEADEWNNTNWQRVAVCGDPQGVEVADGFDNDCDGLTDEGLGLSAAADDALEMLRVTQRRAVFDSVPLLYAIPRFPEGFARRRTVRLASQHGQFIVPPGPPPPGGRRGSGRRGQQGGRRGQPGALLVGDLSATGTEEDPAAELTLIDWNGADLVSGDPISLQDRDGNFVVVDARRDGRLVTRTESRQHERLFRLIKLDGPTAAPVAALDDDAPAAAPDVAATEPDGIIHSGDWVALVAPNGRYLQAEAGGGGQLWANRSLAAGWETFTLILDDDGGSR